MRRECRSASRCSPLSCFQFSGAAGTGGMGLLWAKMSHALPARAMLRIESDQRDRRDMAHDVVSHDHSQRNHTITAVVVADLQAEQVVQKASHLAAWAAVWVRCIQVQRRLQQGRLALRSAWECWELEAPQILVGRAWAAVAPEAHCRPDGWRAFHQGPVPLRERHCRCWLHHRRR